MRAKLLNAIGTITLGSAAALSSGGCGLVTVRTSGNLLGNESAAKNKPASAPGNTRTGATAAPTGEAGNAGSGSATAQAKSVRSDALALVKKLDESLLKQRGPIPSDQLTLLGQKAKALAGLGDQATSRYLAHVATYYRIENAWRSNPDGASDRIAKILGAKAIASGVLTGKDKPQELSFSAQQGNCYIMLSHMKKVAGDNDGLNDLEFDAGSASPTLERFRVDGRRTHGPGALSPLARAYVYGVCATESTSVKVRAKLGYAGTSNGLRYVVVATPRAAFPRYIALNLEVLRSDSCDAENYKLLWTNPIPGSIVYGNAEPFLPYEVGQSGDLWMTAYSASGLDARLERTRITSQPPSRFSFRSSHHFRGCPHQVKNARSPLALKVARCYEPIDKRFDALFDQAHRAVDEARNIVARANAEQRIHRLNSRYDRATRPCERLEDDAGKKMQATYNHIVDFYSSTPPKPYFDRAAAMGLTYKGSG